MSVSNPSACETSSAPLPPSPTALSMLHNLPSSSAFSKFDPTLPTDSFRLYTPRTNPSQSAPPIIKNECTRALIRALRGRKHRESTKRRMVGGCDVVAKRARWADVAPDTRHFCMQAALRAAGEPPARDVDLAGRRALCDGVVNWSKDDIMAYLDCAGLNTQGLGMRELMAAVRKHLGAD